MSGSLIERSSRLVQIMEICEEHEAKGEPIPDTILAELETALTAQSDKVDNCAIFVTRVESEIDWVNKEIELLKTRKYQLEKGIERMKWVAKKVMQMTGEQKLTGLRGHSFALRKSQSVNVVDESKVPGEFTRISQKIEVNKADALKALKNGVQIPGLELKENESVIVK